MLSQTLKSDSFTSASYESKLVKSIAFFFYLILFLFINSQFIFDILWSHHFSMVQIRYDVILKYNFNYYVNQIVMIVEKSTEILLFHIAGEEKFRKKRHREK